MKIENDSSLLEISERPKYIWLDVAEMKCKVISVIIV